MSAVYEIRNSVTAKVYIGSTTRALSLRKREHWKRLRGGYHHNEHLQRAWDKYGEAAFSFVPVLTLNCTEEEIRELENEHIGKRQAKLGVDGVYTFRNGTENPMRVQAVRERHAEAMRRWSTSDPEHAERAPNIMCSVTRTVTKSKYTTLRYFAESRD